MGELEAEVTAKAEEAAGHQKAAQETREKAKGKLLELKGQVEALQAQLSAREGEASHAAQASEAAK